MARKRQIKVERVSATEPSDEDIPKKFRDEGWNKWFKESYAKWWYGLLCMIVDLFLALEVSRYLSGSWIYFVPLIVVLILVMLEIYLFHRLWGGLDFLFGDRRLI
ncbi:MAG: hypothetical protein GKC03_06015 [Methanomassiliicoccales archaeon]|nr:hypothetical protein [Methanomassiliicoccales archaeon]